MAVLDDVTMELITARAREIRFGRMLLTLVAGFFFGLGWLAAKIVGWLWLALAWIFAAVRVGWQEGRSTKPSPRA